MTEAQADQIIDFLYGMHRPPDQDATRRAWRMQLATLDPDLASRACINGMQVWTWFPSWTDFFTEYRMLARAEKNATRPADECKTCKGDTFVVVALRDPVTTQWMELHGITANTTEKIEEWAPCPACAHGVNTAFRRHDGSEVQAMDPALVRRMLSS